MNLYNLWLPVAFLLLMLNELVVTRVGTRDYSLKIASSHPRYDKPVNYLQTNGIIRLSSSTAKVDTLPTHFRFGRVATTTEIARLDTDVRPDGKGLPPGEGKVVIGKQIFATKCAACHGTGGVGGPSGSLVTTANPDRKRPEKTIGNYWPYATTVFDYIRRAMPFSQPGSLTNDEVYHVTAYLLQANGIIDEKTVINAQTLPRVVMPAQKLFVPDDRTGGPEIK